MFQIILIKPNEFNLNDIPYKTEPNKVYKTISRDDFFSIKSNYVDIPKMKEKILSYIEIINVKDDNFMEKIVELINFDNNKNYGDVRDCYDDPNNIYQVMFKLITQYDNRKNLKNNLLASIITYKKELIYDNAVLFKTYLPKDNHEMSNIDVLVEDIINLIMNNIYHTGIYVNDNNIIEQIFFNNSLEFVDPYYKFVKRNDIDHIMKNKKYSYRKHEILKYNIQFIFEKDSHDHINDPMSRLIGAPIRGKGMLISPCDNDNSFYDLSREEIINLLQLSPNYDMTSEDHIEKTNTLGCKIIKNKYRIVNSKLNL